MQKMALKNQRLTNHNLNRKKSMSIKMEFVRIAFWNVKNGIIEKYNISKLRNQGYHISKGFASIDCVELFAHERYTANLNLCILLRVHRANLQFQHL